MGIEPSSKLVLSEKWAGVSQSKTEILSCGCASRVRSVDSEPASARIISVYISVIRPEGVGLRELKRGNLDEGALPKW